MGTVIGRRALGAALLALSAGGTGPTTAMLDLRGKELSLRLYGAREGAPVVLASGDGGWIHLAPHVAELLAERGWFVVGLDARAYLSTFTGRSGGLAPAEVAEDFRALARYASRPGGPPPVLIGVSEGAGLSVLAAADPPTRASVAGVVGLGLPARNELAWRWRDAIIYLTHKPPDEPGFDTADVIGRVAPLPLALLHSTHDAFAPLTEAQAVFRAAGEPMKVWVIDAEDHDFGGRLPELDEKLVEALAWIEEQRAAGRRPGAPPGARD